MAMATLLPWLAWLMASLVAVYLLNLLAHTHHGLPPGPLPLPLVGSLHLLGDLPHRSLAKLAKIYGPVMSLLLGTITTVVASTPEAAREFLQKHDAVFATRSVPDALRDHARHSVPWLPHHSPHWRTVRRIMVTELLSSHRLDALQHLRRDKVQELVEHVGRLAREGAAVDIGRVAFATTLNLMSRTIFSSDVMDLDDHGWSNEFKEVIAEIMEVAARSNLSDFFPALAVVDLQGRRCRMVQLLAQIHKVFDVEVDRRLGSREAGEARRNDFLDQMLDAAWGIMEPQGWTETCSDQCSRICLQLEATQAQTQCSGQWWNCLETHFQWLKPVMSSKGLLAPERTLKNSKLRSCPIFKL